MDQAYYTAMSREPTRCGVDSAVEALAIFHGNQGYVSPSWYKTKPQTGRVVPTWNYAVVRVRKFGNLHRSCPASQASRSAYRNP